MVQVVALDEFMIDTLRELVTEHEAGLESGDIVVEDRAEAIREIRAIGVALQAAETVEPQAPVLTRPVEATFAVETDDGVIQVPFSSI